MTSTSGGVVFQVAHHEFHLDPGPPEMVAALRVLVQRARHDLPVRRRSTYRVVPGPRGYRIVEDGDELAVLATPPEVLEAVYARVAARAVELTCRLGWVRLHAGSVDVAGRRLLLVGDSGSGKTTLTLALGAAGARVQADEITLVRDGEALALARRFHCKPGTEAVLPELADAITGAPRATHAGEEIRALDPSELGWEWRIATAPVDAIVLLSAERRPAPELVAVPSPVAFAALAQAVLRFVETETHVRSQLVRLLARPVWQLHPGTVDATADALAGLASSL